jgi:hypothetical protein
MGVALDNEGIEFRKSIKNFLIGCLCYTFD